MFGSITQKLTTTVLRLKPKNTIAERKIADAGTDVWLIQHCEPCVHCLKGKPGVLVKPEGGNENQQEWLAIVDDKNFEYEELLH